MKISLSVNPVLVKELRGRMRGARAYLILTSTLALMGLTGYGLYRVAFLAAQSYGGPASALIGQSVFIGLAFFALGIICFVTPALTAGAISGEHERKTFDMLIATPLSPAAVLFGKLVASLSYVALLLMATVPMVSLSYVFGGVATLDMIQAMLLLFGYTLTFGIIGLFFSTLVRRSGLATVLSYIVLAAFIFGSLFVYVVVGVIRQQQPPPWLLALNPFSAMASALVNATAPNMFSTGGALASMLWVLSGGSDVSTMPAPMPLWRYTVGLYAWLAVALYLASTVLIRPVRRFRLGALGWIALASFVVVSILAVPVVYGPWTPSRLLAWVRWNRSPKPNLIVDGTFASLEPNWTVNTEVEQDGEPGGEAVLAADGGRRVLSLSRTGVHHAETGVTQVISQSLAGDVTWLQVRVVLRVKSQDVSMCGALGSECPLMIKLVYDDAGGGRHTWMQGFYAVGSLADSSTPPFCQSCEFSQQHIQVPLDQWYTYESPNLVQDLSERGYIAPRLIRSITLAAAGHSYEAQVAEVALLTGKGELPPNLAPWSATPTPPPFGPMMMGIQQEIVGPAPPIVLPAPAPTEAPPATSTPVPPPGQ